MLAVELELDGGEPLVGGGVPMDLRAVLDVRVVLELGCCW